MIKRFLNIFLELLFPSKCINCNLRGSILCNTCINNIHLAERPTEESIIALYDYRDQVIKKAIWQLKYYNIPHLGQKLGELLYTELIEEIQLLQTFSQGSPIIVIPVPISKNKKKNRGYNQSEIIARNFRKSSPVKIFDLKTNIIIKKSNTIPQARLTNRNKRLQNIIGSFEIKNIEQIKGKTIIIIDDVTTTGGTMLEIMKVLKKSGAKKVIGFAVAH
jgi:competence protein ComFC